MPRYRDDWPQYISIAERKRKADREAAKIEAPSPVVIEGSRIATTFWGTSWCANLERYSDYANRLPRGRTYVRSGCVVDLKIMPGGVSAAVSGSRLYRVDVNIKTIPPERWKAICHDCAGAIDSLVELLEGRFAKETMERLCKEGAGMFPLPAEIRFSCTCPDSARMCKHVAAVLYGIGARLDEDSGLLFTLRKVNKEDLITNAGRRMTKSKSMRVLEGENLSELFGIDIAEKGRKPKMGS
jgi:uncharacterized Zn finger protein